jgi:hypothetical protein
MSLTEETIHLIKQFDKAIKDCTFDSIKDVYGIKKSPVKYASNWLYLLSTKEIFAEHGQNIISFCEEVLASDKYRPHNKAYICRYERDRPNGLIGQACAIRGLRSLARIRNEKKYRDQAIKLYELHAFNQRRNLWHRVSLDGDRWRVDETLNHQLCFAAFSQGLKESMPAIDSFKAHLNELIDLHDSGCIRHVVSQHNAWRQFFYDRVFPIYAKIFDPSSLHSAKEHRYHYLNTYLLFLLDAKKHFIDGKNHKIRKYLCSKGKKRISETPNQVLAMLSLVLHDCVSKNEFEHQLRSILGQQQASENLFTFPVPAIADYIKNGDNAK